MQRTLCGVEERIRNRPGGGLSRADIIRELVPGLDALFNIKEAARCYIADDDTFTRISRSSDS